MWQKYKIIIDISENLNNFTKDCVLVREGKLMKLLNDLFWLVVNISTDNWYLILRMCNIYNN